MNKQYVLGFMFNKDKNIVLLIHKLRPDWQENYLNGIGGHIESGETAREAIVREFQEETGIKHFAWNYYLNIQVQSTGAEIFIFAAESDDIYNAKSITDEIVNYYNIFDLPINVIPNLRWMIPMALAPLQLPIKIIEFVRGGFSETN